MKLRSYSFLLPAMLLLASATPFPNAQGQDTSAREALDLVGRQFGSQSVQWVAEMHARNGVPQPPEWDILSYDARMPRLLYQFRAGMGRVGDIGPDQQRYPVNVPVGYFSPNQIVVDSVAAFTIAEGEARKAKVAFDSCDYMLRVREFSTDPLWRLELLDARRQIVGKIYLSATSGAVMRTVWVYADPSGNSRIVDSSAPSNRNLTTGITGDPYPVREPVPGESAGIVRVPPSPDSIPADAGIGTILPPPTPGNPSMSRAFPPSNATPGGVQPYRPVGPNGNVVDDSIPDPPAVAGPTTPAAPNGVPPTGQMRDLRDGPPAAQRPDPNKPPIEIPTSGGGSSERIPPPPIPPGS